MKTRGIVTLVFDDGYEMVYQNVIPLLAKYNIPGVFALTLDKTHIEHTEKQNIRPYQDWLHIQKQGHELAAHSITHRDLTTLPQKELQQELHEPMQQFNATTIVYPGGAQNDTVTQKADKYYSAGRTTIHGYETIPPKNPMALKTFNFTRENYSTNKANMLVLWALLTNKWMIETYHMVDENTDTMLHSVRTSDLEKHLHFITKLPIDKKTIHDVI